ncbi:MAG: HAMP domain-containing histidine kinase [Nitrospinae bacterium]|nr:HAMP domain-containing histidine kinase [Nitrospinota bacterium]
MMFRSLSSTLAALFAALAAAAALTAGIAAHTAARAALESEREREAAALRDDRRARISGLFNQAAAGIETLAAEGQAALAIHDFEEGAYLLAPSLGAGMEKLNNPPAGTLPDDPARLYHAAFARHHSTFSTLARGMGLADLLLVSPEGGVVIYAASGPARRGARLDGVPAVARALKEREGAAQLSVPGESALGGWLAVAPVTEGGRVVGALAGIISRERVEMSLSPGAAREGMAVALYTDDGALAASSGVAPERVVWQGGEEVFAGSLMAALGFAAGAVWLARRGALDPLARLAGAVKSAAGEGTRFHESGPGQAPDEILSLWGLFADLNGRLAALRQDLESRDHTQSRYADALATLVEAGDEELASLKETLAGAQAALAGLAETAERQEREIERLRKRLEAASDRSAALGRARDRLRAAVTQALARSGAVESGGSAGLAGAMEEMAGALERGLVIATAEGEMLTMERAAFDFSAAAREAVDRFHRRAAARGVALVFENDGASLMALGDRARTRLAMDSLVESAVLRAAGKARVSVHEEGDMVCFEAAGEGPGLDAAELERLFRAPLHGGEESGLGLYYCRLVARGCDGKLSAESAPGKGNVFRLSLPKDHTRQQESLPGL